jgi:hypothetical protein
MSGVAPMNATRKPTSERIAIKIRADRGSIDF